MLGLVRHVWACQTFSEITNCQYLWERFSYFVYLLPVVTHPGKLQCYHVILVRYVPACPKFSEITNHQYLKRVLSDFVDFLHVVICILLDSHWSYQNLLFSADIVRHRLAASQIVRCFKLEKNWKLYEISSWLFVSIEVCAAKYSWCISFDLVELLILIPGVHYYIVFVSKSFLS